MSDDTFQYNRHDRDPGETAGDARIRQREVFEKRNNGGQGVVDPIISSPRSMPYSGRTTSKPVEISDTALLLGVIFFLVALMFWSNHFPVLSGLRLFGIPIGILSFAAGLLCVAFRFAIGLVVFAFLGITGIMVLTVLIALMGEVPLVEMKGNIAAAVVSLLISFLIPRIFLRKKNNSDI